MPTGLATNKAARDAVLGRVKKALGATGDRAAAKTEAQRYISAHAHGPRPAMPADLLTRFMQRAVDMESTVERVPDHAAIPYAVARYINALDLPPGIAAQKSHKGVCWPEFADLDWKGAGLDIEARPTLGEDRKSVV